MRKILLFGRTHAFLLPTAFLRKSSRSAKVGCCAYERRDGIISMGNAELRWCL